MTNTDLTVLLKTVLDKSRIKNELKKFQAIIDKYPIEIKTELKTASLKKQVKSISNDLAKNFKKTYNINLTTNDISKTINNEINKLENATKRYSNLASTLILANQNPQEPASKMQNTESSGGKKDSNFLKEINNSVSTVSDVFNKLDKLKKNFDWFCNKNYLKIA